MRNSKDDKFISDSHGIDKFDQEFVKFIDELMEHKQAMIKIMDLQQGMRVSKYISQLSDNKCNSNSMVEMAINELIINAIEHGLLKINYDTKAKLLEDHNWYEYIVARLAKLPKEQFISIKCTLVTESNTMKVDIIDPGTGFDLVECEKNINFINRESIIPKHGRGMILINNVFAKNSLKYFLHNENNGDV